MLKSIMEISMQGLCFSHEKNRGCCIDIFMTNDFTTDCTRFRLLGDVAKNLHVPPHRIVYLLSSGQVPEPAVRLGGRRIFLPEDVERLAWHLNHMRDEDE